MIYWYFFILSTMATALKNLSTYDPGSIPNARKMKFGIVVSEWNQEITFAMRDSAIETLTKYGASREDIVVKHVPGSFELTLGAQWLAKEKNLMLSYVWVV